MRRIFSYVIGAIALSIVAILFLIFVTLSRQRDPAQPSTQTQPAYPIITQANLLPFSTSTLPPSKYLPPPATPSPIPRSPDYITETALAYPPPGTPNPLTVTQQATGAITPVPPTPIPTTSGPLPPGLKIVYSETNGAAGTTTIWITTIGLTLRKQLIILTHKAGYGISGAVSPDGKVIAYIIIPPGASEQSARTKGGALWVVNSDGSNPHQVAGEVANLYYWSPDSSEIVYYHLVELSNPNDPQIPLQAKLYSVNVNGTGQKMILSNDIDNDIYPIGWSPDALFFYFEAINLNGRSEIWKTDTHSGRAEFQYELTYSMIQSIRLSPDGNNFLISGFDTNHQYNLEILSIDGKYHQIILSGAKGDQASNIYTAVWSSNNKDLLAYVPSNGSQSAGLGQIEISPIQIKPLILKAASQNQFLLPQSWSPDGMWAIVLQYPRPQSDVYLFRFEDGSTTQISPTESSNWITPLGWIKGN